MSKSLKIIVPVILVLVVGGAVAGYLYWQNINPDVIEEPLPQQQVKSDDKQVQNNETDSTTNTNIDRINYLKENVPTEILNYNSDKDNNDSDLDGLPDNLEDILGTNHNKSDSDDDGFNDIDELKAGYNPLGNGTIFDSTDDKIKSNGLWYFIRYQQSNDAQRFSNISTIRTALDLYYKDYGVYPSAEGEIILGKDVKSLTKSGWGNEVGSGMNYMNLVYDNTSPGGIPFTYCTTDNNDIEKCSKSISSYIIKFKLEIGVQTDFGVLGPGLHIATPNGFQ